MIGKGKLIRFSIVCFALLATSALLSQAQTQPAESAAQAPAPGSAAHSVGTVKAVAGSSITLTTEAGADVSVLLQPPAVMVRTAPGHKDLQGATAIQLQDIKAGDRMLVRGKLSDDGKTIMATSAIVMKHEDIVQKQQQEQDDWRKRGINGVVKSVDRAVEAITITTGTGAAAKTIAVRVSKETIIRRYAPDSVKFDDAKLATIDQIKPGDQLRARGERSPDGSEFTAEEIVTGSFRNLAGTVVSANVSNSSVTITDLLSKKQVTVKVGPDSQLRKLPLMIAQGIALRLKGGPPGAAPGVPAPAGGSPAGGSPAAGPGGPAASGAGVGRPGGGGGVRAGGQADFQQMLGRMPAVALSDLQKGDAVVIVTTEGSATSDPTAITLLTGVEPILSASPTDNRAAMTLSPWSLEAPGGDAGP